VSAWRRLARFVVATTLFAVEVTQKIGIIVRGHRTWGLSRT
jgi:hypothetical protein